MKDVWQNVGYWKEGDGEYEDGGGDNFFKMKHSTAGTNALFKTDIAASRMLNIFKEKTRIYILFNIIFLMKTDHAIILQGKLCHFEYTYETFKEEKYYFVLFIYRFSLCLRKPRGCR